MSLFVAHPAQLSKSRLKSDLVAHNVPLPPAKSRKEVYVELHMKHINQKKAADFSSDEEEDVADKEDDPQMPDPSGLTDDDLKAALLEHGVKAGPIVGSTRVLYEKKLRKLLQPGEQCRLNGVEKDVLYSDSEEEEEEGEEESGEEKDEEPGSQEAKEERVEQSHRAQQESNQEPVKDTFKDISPKTNATLTGIYATRRRPIKGAAGRPVQYAYPDCPASPTTLERQQVERRLVPIQIQILVFIIVTFLLYVIYVCVEDNSFSPFVAFLDSLNLGPDSEEGLLLQAEMRDMPALSGQE